MHFFTRQTRICIPTIEAYIYMHIYITTECVNTVHCWQRRMYATSLTQHASIINITVQHSWSNTQVSTSFHSFYWKRHRFHTYQQKLIITQSLKISHKNLSSSEYSNCLLDIVGGDVKLSTVVDVDVRCITSNKC